MQKLALFVAISTTTLFACVLPKMPFMSGGAAQSTQSTESRTVATSETHTVNGHPVDASGNREDDDDDDAPRAKHKANKKPHAHGGGGDIGATCRENSDCASNTCYVGSGELGYCTQICTGFDECPTFWECTHDGVGNAPQKICQQKADD